MSDPSDLRIARQSATLRALVEEKLRSAIVTGLFPPGQRLVERKLCELTGVGRTSIREGLRQLEAEGLVTNVPHKGPFVSTIDYKQAKEIYEIREQLEALAGCQFAEQASKVDRARLVAAVDELEIAAGDPDRVGSLAAKRKFYDALLEGCDNTLIRQILTPLLNRINLLRATSMMQPGRILDTVAEMREIRDALVDRDGARARVACCHHVQMAARAALSYLCTHNSE